MSKRATERAYLLWWFQTADFGPGDDEVRAMMTRRFVKETTKLPPRGFYCCDQCGKDREKDCEC